MDLTPMDDVSCGNFYDQVDDLIDYPLDNECSSGGLVSFGDCITFPSIWDGALLDAAEPLLLWTNDNLASDLPAETSVPNEDITQLEWFSTFMEDSFSGDGMTLTMDNVKKIPLGPMDIKQNYNGTQAVRRCQHCAITRTPQWRSGPNGPKTLCNACGVRYRSGRLCPEYRPAASPTFVPPLHSKSHRKVTEMRNKLVEKKSVDVTQPVRTKRQRSATFCPCMSFQPTSPNPPSHENQLIVLSGISSESESVGESENGKKYHKPKVMEEKMKKKMITPKIPLGPMDITQNYNGTQAVKSCQHCAITKTIRWRTGPMGPKTLCNACGFHYWSGRLFPEYRPAASPTFVPSLPSSSHRKVREMRNKLVEEKSVAWTKRPRSATFSPCTSVQLTSPNPIAHENNLIVLSGISSESESVGESENGKKYHTLQAVEEKMKKIITPKIPLGPTEIKQNYNGTQAVRRCQHCAITKTPLWRNGPMGPKSLCNACGVRYRSGRLYPEYRPAASPTFVPFLHSNSRRKVIVMRNKLVEEKSVDVTQHARTRCPRSATFSPCTSVKLTSPNPPSYENNLIDLSGISSESESLGESENGKKYHNPQAMEEKMIALKIPLGPMDIKQNNNGTQAIGRCQHGAKTKPPQWGTGPMGPKTLCNACGVRYKSKRLLPEYRPAASPSFVPPLHSNSHRKVIEMRNKLVEEKSVGVTQHARTKRPRSATFSPCTSVQLTSPNPPSHENNLIDLSGISSESVSVGESENGKKYHKPQAMEEKMKKMITPKIPLGPMEIKQNNGTQAVRRCHHWAITETPQWRTGPKGSKTLCNACGVLYDSGRLFPEYCPAASPTFVPHLHSNSHRKVIGMRNIFDGEKSETHHT